MNRTLEFNAPPRLITSECVEMNTISRLAGWQADYRQLESGKFAAWYDVYESSRITVTSQYCNRGMLASGTPPAGCTALLLPLTSNAAGAFNGSEFRANDVVMFNPDSETNYRTPTDLQLMTVTIPTDSLVASINSLNGSDNGETLTSGLLRTNLSPAELINFQLSSRRLLQIARSAGGEPNLGLSLLEIEQVLIGILTRLLPGPVRPVCDTRARRNYLRYLRRARDYVEANLHKHLYLQDIAGASGTSQRTLESAFQYILGLTPAEYIRNRRLTAIRQRLRHPNGNTKSVSAVAQSYGFNHMGHFGQYYRALFDELPHQTLSAALGRQA